MADQDEGDGGGERSFRRTFLKAAAAAAVAMSCGGDDVGVIDSGEDTMDTGPETGPMPDTRPTPDTAMDTAPPVVDDPPELTPETRALFELGVSSGDVTHEEAVIWTQYSGSMPLAAAVWEMNDDVYERVITDGFVTPAAGGHVHVTVPGLTGGQRYRYAFFEMDETGRVGRSLIGRFRAALAPGQTEDLLIGVCSCTKNGFDFLTLERAGSRDDLDTFLLLGDTTYNDGAVTIDDHRTKWAENLRTPGYLTTRAATSVLATWDDHEVRDNFDGEDPMIEEGRRAFFEHLPLRRDATNPDRMWKSIRWGNTVEFFVLDCRGERRPSTVGITDEYISRAQMDWLKAGLLGSTAVFKIILNSVPISNFPGVFDFAREDRWEGYPRQRDEIIAHIDDSGITGILWTAGDFHLCSAQRVADPGQPGENQVEILAGPGGNTGNPLAAALRSEPRFDFASPTNNYVTLELFPTSSRIRVRWIDGTGSVFEVREYVV